MIRFYEKSVDSQRQTKRHNGAAGKKSRYQPNSRIALSLPDRRFHRHIGAYAAHRCDPAGHRLTPEQWNERRDEFLPGPKDSAYVRNLCTPVMEIGKIAHWISKPTTGIHGMPFEFEYVRREQ